MDENTKSNLNLYDYVGFPDLQQRIEAKTVFNTEKLLLEKKSNQCRIIVISCLSRTISCME